MELPVRKIPAGVCSVYVMTGMVHLHTISIGRCAACCAPDEASLALSKHAVYMLCSVQDKVVNEMEELYDFMRSANSVLEQRVGDEGVDAEADGDEAEPEELPEGVDPAELRREKEEEVSTSTMACHVSHARHTYKP